MNSAYCYLSRESQEIIRLQIGCIINFVQEVVQGQSLLSVGGLGGISPRRCRTHHLQRREPLRGFLLSMASIFDQAFPLSQ